MSADGSKLYAINQSPDAAEQATGTVNSYLDGIYVSHSGSIAGPWSKIADSHEARQLRLGPQAVGRRQGLRPRDPGLVQPVPPRRPDRTPNHVYAGLEEVYETRNGGSSWNTVGPYWNFYFSCWAPDAVYPPNGAENPARRRPTPTSTRSRSAARATTQFVVVGNDGGIYRRPLNGSANGNGNATDWTEPERRHDRRAAVLRGRHRQDQPASTRRRRATSTRRARRTRRPSGLPC